MPARCCSPVLRELRFGDGCGTTESMSRSLRIVPPAPRVAREPKPFTPRRQLLSDDTWFAIEAAVALSGLAVCSWLFFAA